MKQSNLPISVVMTTYNHEKYIRESINSILDQTFKEFEIIIIDDGSIDKTAEIIKTFNDDRIQYIYQENQGVSTAINNGVLVARGQYISLISGDDVCYPHKLEKQYNYLSKSNNKVLLFSWVDFINEDSEIFSGAPYIPDRLFDRENQAPDKILRYFFEKGNYICAPTAFMERSALISSGLFDTSSVQLQDFYKWIELLGSGYEIFVLPEKLLKYRVNGQTLSQAESSKLRVGFEHEILAQDFFKNISIDLFKKTFKELIKNRNFNIGIEYELEKAFIYLNYNSLPLRKIGSEKLFYLLKDAAVLSVSKSKYNFDLPALYRLMSNVFSDDFEYNIQYVGENLESKFVPLVSVCIPTYNGENFIEETLNTVLSQNYPNLEIIISDDNSKDRTIEIAESFREKSTCEFSILEHGQYGLSQNWNFCISQAKGKYIKFVFQDDLLEPDAISRMVELAEQDEEIGLVFSPRRLFMTEGDTYYDPTFIDHHGAKDIHKGWSNLESIQSGQELLKDQNLFNYSINKIGEPTTVLIKKEIFDKVGLFNSDLCQLVDLEMWLRIISECKVGFVNKYLSHFRIHEHQQTNRNSAEQGLIVLDHTRFFHIIYSDARYPDIARQNAFYRYVLLCEQNHELSQARTKLAKEWLKISDELVMQSYHGMLGMAHEIVLMFNSLRSASFTPEDKHFVSDANLAKLRDFDRPGAIKQLLLSMLYYRPEQLSMDCDLSHVPEWLLQNYLQFIFSAPMSFNLPGEADKYYRYIQGWVDYLHESILAHPTETFWQNVASNFAQLANFIPVYFNGENLRDIYVKRAEIIELSLNNGSEVDHQFDDQPTNRKKVRLGILATHFIPSAETFAALPMYEYLSREFEVVLYSFQRTNHPLEQYCQSSANFFVTLPENLAEQVSAIRRDDLDILFFATNITAVTNQMCLLASHRLARIQVTSGGSVVTTGMRNMDYFLSGTFTDPSAIAQEQYQEKLIQLPGAVHCFSYGDVEEKSTINIDRKQLGISDNAVVFTSGANFYKITPELIHTWAKIIAAVPNSSILLFPYGPNWSSRYPKQAFGQHIHKIFAEYGVSADRVITLDPQPVPNREDLKEYYKLADVYLDSYPFAGTTSLIEPLQVNLPVIARQGNSFRSSMGAAMIRSLEIDGLVADSEESYIQLAVVLGNNPELRQQKSAEVKAKMADNPSFLDSKGYGAKIGELFKELVDRYSRDALSDNLRLKDVNLMVFPDWSQSEESVGLELQQVIQTLATQPDAQKTTLLIDTTNIAIEDAEMFLSSVAMNLMMEEDLDIMEELEISLIEDLNNIQWDNLLPRISARIVLECDNQEVVGKLPHEKLPQRQLESFVLS